MNQNVLKLVNKQIANWTVLFMKLHHFHWYVNGPHFFSLHEKFEELYNEAAVNIDKLAERLLALGGKPVATLNGCLELSSLKEAEGEADANEMVSAISDDFTMMIRELKEAVEASEEAADEPTTDMLIAIWQSLEKHNWMLKAFLNE